MLFGWVCVCYDVLVQRFFAAFMRFFGCLWMLVFWMLWCCNPGLS